MTIKTKLFVILLGLIVILMVCFAFLGITSFIGIRNDAQKITSDTLRNQSEKVLIQLTNLAAEKNDLILEKVRKDASNVATYAANIFDNAEIFLRGAYWKFDDHVFRGDKGQYLNGKDDVSSLFIPNHVHINDDLKKRVELSAYLDFIFPKVLENNPNAVAIWMVGPEHESRYYPNIGLGNIAPPDENVLDEVFFAIANPQNNPERKVVWTPAYDDPAAQGLMITASAPIYTKKGFFGVLGIDVALNTISSNIEKYNPIEDSYSFLIDKDGRAIALPDKAYNDILGRAKKPGEHGADLNNITNEFHPVLEKMKEGSTGSDIIRIGDKEFYVAYAPLEGTGFSIGTVAEKTAVLKAVSALQKEIGDVTQKMIYARFLPLDLIILLLTFVLVFLLSKSISNPLIKLRDATIEIGKGNLDAKIEVKTKDEIGELAKAFGQMTSDLKGSRKELENYAKTLEQKVEEKTFDLQSKVNELSEARLILQSLAEDIQKEKEGVEIKVKERTKEFSEEHGRLSSLVESIKLGVVMVDLSLNVILANPAAKRFLGKPLSGTLTFKDLDEKMKDTVKISQALSYYVQTGKPFNIQEVMIDDRYFRLFMSPVRDIIEKIFIGAVIVIEDITEQKKLDTMRTEIVSVTSHQLRTPLSVIKGNLEMVLEGDIGKITKEQKEVLEEAFLGNERMIKLVNDLMDVSKIEEGKFELTLEPTQLDDLAAEVVKEILPFAKKKHVSLSYISPSVKLPKAKIDRQKIKRVLQNLIDNAIRYSQIDSKGKVSIEVQKDTKFLKFVVKDNGVGIPKDEQGKIFERFARGSNVAQLDPGGGTGLGLYIVKAIIEQSKGKIWFESEQGKGSAFYFTLPFAMK